MAEVYKLNNNGAIRNLESDLTEANKKIAYLQNELLETVVAEAEETYNEVGEMTTPSSVTIGSTAYPVIDNTKMELKEVLGKTIVSENSLIDSTFSGIKTTGGNLFDIDNLNLAYTGAVGKSYVTKVENGVIYSGGREGYSAGSYLLTQVNSGTYTISGKLGGLSCSVEYGYCLSVDSNSIMENVTKQGTGGKTGIFSYTITIPSDGYIIFAFYSSAQYGTTLNNYQVERGTTATTYKKYVETLGQITFLLQTLKGAGTARDRLVITKNTNNDLYTLNKINNVGQIDLGTINWTYLAGSQFFYNGISNRKKGKNVLCSQYTQKDVWVSSNDKCYDGNDNNNTFYVKDTTYNNVTTFKNAMSGVMLNYELETPTETTLYNDLTYNQVSFLTQQGGTIIIDNTSLAKGDIKLLETIKYFRSN